MKKVAIAFAATIAALATPILAAPARHARPVAQCVVPTDAETGTKSDVKARYTFLYQYDAGVWEIEHLHSSVLPAKP